jgi:hypothetical protein
MHPRAALAPPAVALAAALVAALAAAPLPGLGEPGDRYPWPRDPSSPGGTIASRFAPPAGYARVAVSPGSFGAWLRGLPLRPGRPDVLLFDGTPKANQAAHVAVVDLDVGTRDLQQCADAVIRLRAEYLRAAGRERDVCFRFTSGEPASWARWADGWRPTIAGDRITWARGARPARGYGAFRDYLATVFRYAGTASLARGLAPVERVEPGDVFVQGGFPGHAVIAVDVAESTAGRAVLLAQSYMPAQQLHVLVDPGDPAMSPWYRYDPAAPLVTPECRFPSGRAARFAERGCPPRR